MSERRLDPRTDTAFSLRNLLRVRAVRYGLALAVLSTAEGVLMAGSAEDRAAERVAAHVATELRAEHYDRVARAGQRTGAQLNGLRFSWEGRPLVLAVLAADGGPATDEVLDELAARVGAILGERRA